MAKEFLDLPQISASRQEVRSKGMAKGMRGRRFRQAKPLSQPLHGELDNAGRKRSAFYAEKQRIIHIKGVGAQLQVFSDGILYDRQNRNQPLAATYTA